VRGAGIYVINSTFLNPYYLADFSSYRCDDHYLDYVAGAPLRTGISVGKGSKNGEVRNAMFNGHYWCRAPYQDKNFTEGKGGSGLASLLKYQNENLEAFVFGYCENELQFENFNFNSRIGLHFITEGGNGASGFVLGHGSDYTKMGVVFDGVGKNGLVLVNTECDVDEPGQSADEPGCFVAGKGFKSAVTLYNTMFWWGKPRFSVKAQSGTLRFELAHFNQYGQIRAEGGRIELVNVYLNKNHYGDTEFVIENGGSIQTTGCQLFGTRVSGGKVDSRFDAHYGFPLPEGLKEISVTLDRIQKKAGIYLGESADFSKNVPVVKDGRAAWVGVKEPDIKRKGYYMYFYIDYPEFKDGKAPSVAISVDYFDEGAGYAEIVYDSSDELVKGPNGPGSWKLAKVFKLTDSKTWKTVECTVKDALFSGRCNGADLRLNIVPEECPAVASMKISKVE